MSAARAVRRGAVAVHRWTGLALAGFLVVIAATGALLPFQTDLQRLIAPERFAPAPTRPIDWLKLRETAERRSGGVVDILPLQQGEGAAPVFYPSARPGAGPLSFNEIVLDPATGVEIGRARIADLRDGRAQVMPFLYRLHQQLALGKLGALLLGVVALAWTVDCFVGFYLTLPVAPAGWWRRWRVAWKVRWPAPSAFRLHFDLHRAGGLWLWGMMFVFAWTGVGFNLPAVYRPVMHALAGYEVALDPPPAPVVHAPHLGWSAALTVARARAAEAGRAGGFRVLRERELRLLRAQNRYAYAFRSTRDPSDDLANSRVSFDADTGALASVQLPTGQHPGNTIDYWLALIHVAAFGGLPMRIFVSALGVAVVMVTVTGVLIWLRKRRRPHAGPVAVAAPAAVRVPERQLT